jgi:glutamine synthetase
LKQRRRYASWGWEDREAPLRRITETGFEFKLVCGTANPYLTHCAMLAAGIESLEKMLPLTAGDCQGESPEKRSHLQITTKFPTSINESLCMLQADEALIGIVGEPMVSAYASLTKVWNDHMRAMEEEKRNWIICNY